MLVFIGALDDRFDISVKIRATIQAAVGIVMMVFGKLYLSSLGYIFGSWEMVLGPFGYFLTLFAVWAAINAFNMVDGIDGLLKQVVLRLVCSNRYDFVVRRANQSRNLVLCDDRRHPAIHHA